MEYNTKRERMTIPEYGRNIHKMIDYCVSIEDKEKRTALAHTIVKVMEQMNPPISKSNDYEHKLWDHLHIISGFNLDIDAPFPAPGRDEVSKKPEKIAYSDYKISYPHYGKQIEKVISQVAEMEEGDQKDGLVYAIANYLKKSYLVWNRESVNDETIFSHLEELSGGKVKFNEKYELISISDALSKPRRQKNIVTTKAEAQALARKSYKKKRKRKFK